MQLPPKQALLNHRFDVVPSIITAVVPLLYASSAGDGRLLISV